MNGKRTAPSNLIGLVLIGALTLTLALTLALALGAARAAEIAGQKVSLPTPERAVAATYFRAPGGEKRPAVLLLHGAGGFDRQIAAYDHYASELANNGIDAYLVTYYSAADQEGMARGEEVFQKRYAAWAKMVDDLADSLKKNRDANGKLGLVGFSNGGILASGASARDAAISAAVIYYGGAPWPTLGPVTRFPPLLILHGDADQIIPVREAKLLADFAQERGAKVDLVIYPGESHGFGARLESKDGADALTRTIAFLRKELDVK